LGPNIVLQRTAGEGVGFPFERATDIALMFGDRVGFGSWCQASGRSQPAMTMRFAVKKSDGPDGAAK
jgi:hypothetical protein